MIDTLRAHDAKNGGQRTTKGTLAPQPPPPPPPPVDATTKTIDDYLKDVAVWKQRLEQARGWIEQLSGADDANPKQMTPEERRQRVDSQVAEFGLAKATADHLRDELPMVLIRRIEIHGFDAITLGKRLSLDISNLSSNAALLPEPPKFELTAADQSLAFQFTGPSSTSKGAALDLAMKNVSIDALFAQLKTGGATPVRGGTFDLSTRGSLSTHPHAESTFELPLQVTLRDTTFALPGTAETKIDQLLLPIGVSGSVVRPSIALDDKVLADALMRAGKQELANFVQSKAGQLLGKIPGAAGLVDLSKPPEQLVDDAKKAAEDAAKKALDDAKKAAEDAAKKAAEEAAKKAAADAAKKGLGEGLKGLLPGGKKN